MMCVACSVFLLDGAGLDIFVNLEDFSQEKEDTWIKMIRNLPGLVKGLQAPAKTTVSLVSFSESS